MSSDSVIEALLNSLLSGDNAVRVHAEKAFEDAKKTPDELVIGMMRCIRISSVTKLRSIAAVLLRRILLREDPALWEVISDASKSILKVELIQALQEEKVQDLTGKIADIIGEVGVMTLEMNAWPELLPFCREAVERGSSLLRLNALHIFRDASYFISKSMQNDVSRHYTIIESYLQLCRPIAFTIISCLIVCLLL
jgi:hypothetical protein